MNSDIENFFCLFYHIIMFVNPSLIFYSDRLDTFDSWPPQITHKKEDLARSGFYYTQITDTVMCFACGLYISGWKHQFRPFEEHKKYSPNCMFLGMIGYDKGNGTASDSAVLVIPQRNTVPKTQQKPLMTGSGSQQPNQSTGGFNFGSQPTASTTTASFNFGTQRGLFQPPHTTTTASISSSSLFGTQSTTTSNSLWGGKQPCAGWFVGKPK
jgi:hypothetical protein